MSVSINEQKITYLNSKVEQIQDNLELSNNTNVTNTNAVEQNIQNNTTNISSISVSSSTNSNSNVYTKTEIDDTFETKSGAIQALTGQSVTLDNYYTKSEFNGYALLETYFSETEINSKIKLDDPNKIELYNSIIPSSTEIDLGSAEKKFRHLYLSDNTLHLGEQEIKANTEGIIMNKIILGDTSSSEQIKLSVTNSNLVIENETQNYTQLKDEINKNSLDIQNIQNEITQIKNSLDSISSTLN